MTNYYFSSIWECQTVVLSCLSKYVLTVWTVNSRDDNSHDDRENGHPIILILTVHRYISIYRIYLNSFPLSFQIQYVKFKTFNLVSPFCDFKNFSYLVKNTKEILYLPTFDDAILNSDFKFNLLFTLARIVARKRTLKSCQKLDD